MRKIERLRKEAIDACNFRGHKMACFAHSHYDDTGNHCTSYCTVCNMRVFVCDNPLPNEVDICGRAVGCSCDQLYYFQSSSGFFEIEMTMEQAESVSHSGDCEAEVLVLKKEIRDQLDKINPDAIRQELGEYGAWNDKELLDDKENLTRIVWIAGCDIAESRLDS